MEEAKMKMYLVSIQVPGSMLSVYATMTHFSFEDVRRFIASEKKLKKENVFVHNYWELDRHDVIQAMKDDPSLRYQDVMEAYGITDEDFK